MTTNMEIEAAVKDDRQPPRFLPHPDDVVIDPETDVRFIGPWDEASAASLEETLKLRDVLLIQDAWDGRHGRGEGEYCVTVAGLTACMLNERVPARYRLSALGYNCACRGLLGTSKRELRKMLFRGFKDLGHHWSPDVEFPSIADFSRTWDELWDAHQQLEVK